VLAFVVLLTVLALAYFSRTVTDRQVAQSSFRQTNADQLALSAADVIIADLQQEIINGSTASTVNNYTIYTPTTNANMLPMRSGNPSGVPDPIPNLVRRSWANDSNLSVRSRASAVNSTNNLSANGRSVTSTRWNSHYLVPKKNTATTDSLPIDAFTSATPDWVFVTNQGPTVINSPSTLVIGRYAYAIYDEGGLLDMNVAGYPNGTTAAQSGRKGPVAFADLTSLPYPIQNSSSPFQVDTLVGWRNYGTTQPANNFPNSGPPPNTAFAYNFQTSSAPALAYYTSVINNTNGFLATSGAVTPNGRTDQAFLGRQELLAFGTATGLSANALQYLGTFSRELNAPSWTPTQNASAMGGSNGTGSIYAYQTNANSSTAINRNLLSVVVANSFTRPDGTTATVGEPLLKRRFPLSRLTGVRPTGLNAAVNSTIVNNVLQPATTATIQRDLGLQWDASNTRWSYIGASTTNTLQSRILTLDEVAQGRVLNAAGNYSNTRIYREPNFFELLKAVILSGSVGFGSGSANSFVISEQKYYITGTTPSNFLSADYQIMQIGANIISQWDSSNTPTFVFFGTNELAGIKNLPYLNKLVFKPAWITVLGQNQFAAWLLPSLWNPQQNAPPAAQNVRIAMTSGTMTAFITYTGGATPYASTAITGSSTQYMTVDASSFGTVANPSINNPSAPRATVDTGTGSSISQSTDLSPGPYYGFHFPFATNVAVTPSNSLTAYPDFGAGCNFEMQVQVGTTWKAYQRWTGCGPNHPLIFAPPASSWTLTTLQDPEYVTLDPRTLRFGVWGNAGNQPGEPATDYTSGVLTGLDLSVGSPPSTGVFETIPASIAALRPHGTMFASSTSPNLYLYANNADGTVHYTDLDAVQRRGDVLSSGMTTAMQPADSGDRPLILNGRFQSVADLGPVFRDQPWKTLSFTTAVSGATANSADAGLLDVFTMHESSMEAGKTSLNTRQTPVLRAILSQAIKRSAGTSADFITAAQRDSIITALTTLTSAQPMLNKAELITRLAGDPSVTGLGNKEARECVLRAFADACQTRTWDLMIDVIAQSGHYKPNPTSLQNDFIVEGEQRYWVHVAIDRFTGQVIDRQYELVKQ
jgi:hypothetical protein